MSGGGICVAPRGTLELASGRTDGRASKQASGAERASGKALNHRTRRLIYSPGSRAPSRPGSRSILGRSRQSAASCESLFAGAAGERLATMWRRFKGCECRAGRGNEFGAPRSALLWLLAGFESPDSCCGCFRGCRGRAASGGRIASRACPFSLAAPRTTNCNGTSGRSKCSAAYSPRPTRLGSARPDY